jgi:lysophospholipase L1-like esterase
MNDAIMLIGILLIPFASSTAKLSGLTIPRRLLTARRTIYRLAWRRRRQFDSLQFAIGPMKRLFSTVGSALLAVVLVGCASGPRKPALRASDYQGVVRVACVGDSITYGAGVESRELNNYPAVLGKFLGSRFEVRNFGVSGATLLRKGDKPYWNLPEFRAVTDFNPQVVILKLGTNDSKPQNWEHGGEFANDLRAMLDYFIAIPARPKIWVCLPVPVYETRWGINEATVKGEIIPVIQHVAAEKGIPTIDLHRVLSDRPEYFPDKIHPNAAGAGMMAITIFTALKGR